MKIENTFLKRLNSFEEKFNSLNNGLGAKNESSVKFGEKLKEYMDDTNSKLVASDEAAKAFVRGDDTSIEEVMMKNEEASLSLQFLTQTRDKLIEGYNTLSRLQL